MDSRNGFTFKVKTTGIKNKLRNINGFEDFQSRFNFHSFPNQTKEIIYIKKHEFNDGLEESLN